jgi:hypothetical protein
MPDQPAALQRWVNLLRSSGRLLLIEGHWSTGAGITASDCESLLSRHHKSVVIRHLDDPVYWGRIIDDERYLAVSTR